MHFDTDGDGICDQVEITGCQDSAACNYDATATDAGYCDYPEPNYDCDGVCLNDADADGICDADEVEGCTDCEACNYFSAATDDDGSCTYASEHYDCDGECLGDADNDGVCDPHEISGCTDPTACNYVAEATDEDGSCAYAESNYDCDGQCLNDTDADGIAMNWNCRDARTSKRPISILTRPMRTAVAFTSSWAARMTRHATTTLQRIRTMARALPLNLGTTATAIASKMPTGMESVTF